MAWQNVYGSWKHDPAARGDIIMGGGASWNNFPGNPTGTPAPYGRGISADIVSDNVYRLRLSLVGYGVDATTGKFFPSYYAGELGQYIYQWIIKVAISNDDVLNPEDANYRDLFQENFKTIYKSRDPLYGYTNWAAYAYDNTTSNTFTSIDRNAWIRVEIFGDPSVTPLYAYFKLSAAIEEFRPWAIRKAGTFKSLNNSGGFFRIRKSGVWQDVPLMTYDQVGQTNQGTSQIRKGGSWKGQNRIGG